MNVFTQLHIKHLAKKAVRNKELIPVEGISGMKVSAHVLMFLSQYNRKASHILKNKYVRFLVIRRNGACRSAWMAVPNGLEYAYTSIDRMKAGIAAADVRCTAVLAELEGRRKVYRADHAEHMVQLCDNKIQDANRKNALQVLHQLQQIHEIANRQLEVLIDVERQMNKALEHSLGLIECYYINLCALAPGQSFIPSIKELRSIQTIQDFPEEYVIARNNAQDICTACLQQIKELNDQITP